MNRSVQFHQGAKGVAFAVRVIPKGGRNELVEIMDNGCLKVKVSAPAIEGKANDALIMFFSELFKVKPSKIEVIAGNHSRNKIISIMDIDPEQAERVITQVLKD